MAGEGPGVSDVGVVGRGRTPQGQAERYPNSNYGQGVESITFHWRSDANGNVIATQTERIVGKIVYMYALPGTGSNQPTDQYDVTLEDESGLDWLNGAGKERSNAALVASTVSRYIAVEVPVFKVANAGAGKSGIFVLLMVAPNPIASTNVEV